MSDHEKLWLVVSGSAVESPVALLVQDEKESDEIKRRATGTRKHPRCNGVMSRTSSDVG
jgi:hypothetical protein